MPWEFKDDRPIYLQLIEQIQLRIISGLYKAGGRLPSVRDMASEASVNPNTMQKALSELEKTGIVQSQTTSGRFITDDIRKIEKLKKYLATEQSEKFLRSMESIGFNKEESIIILKELGEGNNNE
ncbi:GntR family transcriptional regulator [Clostridium gasigenes]|uniref:GntR family transcriptional regulator n=1 Tax=Clostridium gasigenes TaxID=94869 RepID=UPI0014383989|nr:GntR family transcriptional regulator [Clostridium gasigenes]MBB6625585.1 GntR family transcriptional regulator [Clostridium gasigenes]MBU3090313.1 GntR family transcriptional regulator [Clostridium gasigenes]MBU3106130.1 GntR family transcriptional regulator [Clostridium gasigenes]MBU3133119.1 GntR family transcriptional regulator [Clostridium gasigenes]NKF08741.1 GntR family transcriptional regulator [Clostridium gasigenes]